MITMDHTASYPVGPSAVFAILTDLSGYPAWQADVLDATRHDSGPVRQGSRVTQTRRVMGRRTEILLTVTEFADGERIELRTETGTRPGVCQSYTVTGTETGSTLTFRLQLDGVPKLAEHLVRAQLGKQVPALFERLGERLTAAARD